MSTAATDPLSFLDIQKNSRERLRIQVKEYKGLSYVDLRVWFVGGDGTYAPSSKGVMLKPCHVVEVAQGLLLASQAADAKGMI
ncbi:transcriptional coactivator p15/PC4 family protein [Ralstonia nicotianae]